MNDLNSKENESFNQSEKKEKSKNYGGKRAGAGRKPKENLVSSDESKSTEFTLIVWTESLINYDKNPNYWKEILSKSFLKMVVSPLHDKDVYNELDELEDETHKAGTPKKAHFHVYVKTSRKKYRYEIQKICEKIGGASVLYLQKDLNGFVKYMTHETIEAKNANKYQYQRTDISFFGFDDNLNVDDFFMSEKNMKDKKTQEYLYACDFIDENSEKFTMRNFHQVMLRNDKLKNVFWNCYAQIKDKVYYTCKDRTLIDNVLASPKALRQELFEMLKDEFENPKSKEVLANTIK